VDISDTFDLKMAAWRCFESSAEEKPTPKKKGGKKPPRSYCATAGSFTEQLECRARYYGSLIGARYGEALKKSDFLPRTVGDIRMLFH
jgi:hypothetical protein